MEDFVTRYNAYRDAADAYYRARSVLLKGFRKLIAFLENIREESITITEVSYDYEGKKIYLEFEYWQYGDLCSAEETYDLSIVESPEAIDAHIEKVKAEREEKANAKAEAERLSQEQADRTRLKNLAEKLGVTIVENKE